MMNNLGIDVETADKTKLIEALADLSTTSYVLDGGEYKEDSHFSQVWLRTEWTEKGLDDWLYTTHDIMYVGCFERSQDE